MNLQKKAKLIFLLIYVLYALPINAQIAEQYLAAENTWHAKEAEWRQKGCNQAADCAHKNYIYYGCVRKSLVSGAPQCTLPQPPVDCHCDGTANKGNKSNNVDNTGVNTGASTAAGSNVSDGLSELANTAGNRDNDITKVTDVEAPIANMLGDARTARQLNDIGNAAAILTAMFPPPTAEEQARRDYNKGKRIYERALSKWGNDGNNTVWIASLKESSGYGYPKASAQLGSIYMLGIDGQDQNTDLAKEWYAKAANDDDPEALLWLAGNYESGSNGFPVDIKKAEVLYDRLVQTGDYIGVSMAARAYYKTFRKKDGSIDACQISKDYLNKIIYGKYGKREKQSAQDDYDEYFKDGRCNNVVAENVMDKQNATVYKPETNIAAHKDIDHGKKIFDTSIMKWYNDNNITDWMASLKESAGYGYAQAASQLASIYSLGMYEQPKNIDLAKQWYTIAANDNDPDALMWFVGKYSAGNDGFSRDIKKEEAYLDRLALTDDDRGLSMAAYYYYNSIREKDPTINACQKTKDCLNKIINGAYADAFKKSAQEDYDKYFLYNDAGCRDPHQSFIVGDIHATKSNNTTGTNTPTTTNDVASSTPVSQEDYYKGKKIYDKAFEKWKKRHNDYELVASIKEAADYRYTPAESELASIYFLGSYGQFTNIDLAKEWYAKAADDNDPAALKWLADQYTSGENGYTKDIKQAESLLDKLILTGDPKSMLMAASDYYHIIRKRDTQINSCQKAKDCLNKIINGQYDETVKISAQNDYDNYFKNGECK